MGRKNGHTLAPFVAEHEALLVLENKSHTHIKMIRVKKKMLHKLKKKKQYNYTIKAYKLAQHLSQQAH